MFNSLQIRYKFLASYCAVFFISMLVVMLFTYVFIRNVIEENTESELNNTTQMILNMVETSAWASIKNYLRAVAEKNVDIAAHHYGLYLKGELTEEQAKIRTAAILLGQSIGNSGYIYCLNSKGKVLVHPESELIDKSVADFDFVRNQMSSKKGYIEYDWKNPGENQPRPKALYMEYFEPWDWIISISAYREEFKGLLNVEDLEKSVLSRQFVKTGYSFVMDSRGNAIIHPKLQGVNIFQSKELPNQSFEEMLRRKYGKMYYSWKNPGEAVSRRKMVIFNYIPEFQWIVASSSYADEFFGPLKIIRNFIIVLFFSSLLVVFPITFKISSSITDPLQKLMQHFELSSAGDFSARMTVDTQDEVGLLSTFFNRFMEQLETYSHDLKHEVETRLRAEGAHLESQARYLSVMEATPDPIVTYDMEGKVTYLNPAFTKVYGWTLEECLGKKLDHMVPDENWDETRRMIKKALSGEGIHNVETKRLTKQKQLITISMSGAIYKDRNGNLAGSVLFHRDITKAKQLEKQVMEISDRERQKIGQDLHDDLCPHLIGITGLAAVLKSNLMQSTPEDAGLVDQIVHLIEDAIEKTKILARGLCPVHLVAHGLQSALEKLAESISYSSKLLCSFNFDDSTILHNNTDATHLYYIAQEAVNNAVKHSGGDRIQLSLLKGKEMVCLKVEDNGKGIPEGRDHQGMGLQIMEYRAKIIHAGFEIKSNPKSGTTVSVCLTDSDNTSNGGNILE